MHIDIDTPAISGNIAGFGDLVAGDGSPSGGEPVPSQIYADRAHFAGSHWC
jgi:hypothetical protein